jgi:hypothetical protein
MSDKNQLTVDIDRAEKHLRELKESLALSEQAEKDKRQDKLKPVAEKAHNAICFYNHTDGCGWGYENNNWNGFSHRMWLDRVEKILNNKESFKPITLEQLNLILDHVIAMKQINPSASWVVWTLLNKF